MSPSLARGRIFYVSAQYKVTCIIQSKRTNRNIYFKKMHHGQISAQPERNPSMGLSFRNVCLNQDVEKRI